MVTTVGADDARTHLADYLTRAAAGSERIVLEQDGKPVAALVSIDDLQRLEALDTSGPSGDDDPEKQAPYRQGLEEAGLIVHWPSGEPVPREAYQPVHIAGPPLSEQVIADKR